MGAALNKAIYLDKIDIFVTLFWYHYYGVDAVRYFCAIIGTSLKHQEAL